MAATGAYPMSWEHFYQLEHDSPAEGLSESEQVVSRARLPTACEKNRLAPRWICDGVPLLFLGFAPETRPASTFYPGGEKKKKKIIREGSWKREEISRSGRAKHDSRYFGAFPSKKERRKENRLERRESPTTLPPCRAACRIAMRNRG
ncbi:hypothetical protein KM043_008747 [Ampulex compressa]|nr:hypothetical protein KM043_008747 [Ampulex compressa]